MKPRSWTQPHPPVLAEPDPFLHRRLQIEDAWRADDGEWRPIRAEPTVRLWSILGYLRWHVPLLVARDPEAAAFGGADAYLASRPLVVAIDAELARRGEIIAGTAVVTLRALGPAPWEMPVARSRQRSRRR